MGEGFQEYLERVRPLLDAAFERELQGLLGEALLRNGRYIGPVLNAGKKMRGCLTCIVGEALGAGFDRTIPRAVAVELIQAATLIHDDFVDQDRLRRNKPAVWTLEGARRAVLIGDVIFASAIEMMSALSTEDGLVVSHAIAQVSKGALHEPLIILDLANLIEGDGLNGQLYEKIIHMKTGVLFGAACELGAIAVGADDRLREAARRYGARMGEAYQIADDLKEVRRHLALRDISRAQMTALAPALLRFAADKRPALLEFLRGEMTVLTGPALELFGMAERLMTEEIAARTASAVCSAEDGFPTKGLTGRVLEAPEATIMMFNESN